MTPESLIRDVPTVDEWAASKFHPATMHPAEVEKAYLNEFATRLPAIDHNGLPTMPPDEHLWHAFARVWLPGVEEWSARRADFGTVAVVPERVVCNSCGWGSARYESRVGAVRDFASLCLCCLVRRGDPILGTGHSVLMLLPEELPDRVTNQLLPYLPLDAQPSWTSKRHGDSWDAYRRWGFTGPDEAGRLYAVIASVQVSVTRGPLAAVEIVAQSCAPRHMYAAGGDTHYGPGNLDALDARALLVRVLKREVSGDPAARDELARHFGVSSVERDDRAKSALGRHGGDRWLRLAGYPVADSADYQMAIASAAESDSASLLLALAQSHPAAEVRHRAIGNSALGPAQLARLAADRDDVLSLSLLERPDLPVGSTARVVETLLLAGSLDRHAMSVALKRPDFPDEMVEAVVARIAADGTPARVDLARQVHEAPAERRDAVHLQLLRSARKIKSSVDLINAVIGLDQERARWLVDNPDPRVRSLSAWCDEQRRDE